MITLQQAIDLAIAAHEGQWRNPISINFSQTKIEGYEYNFIVNYVNGIINKEGNLIEYKFNTIFLSKPYITHPLAVMEMMSTEEEKIAAVLHDVLEDTDITTAYLKHQGVPSHLINSLEWLTPIKGESYEDYIKNISHCSLATKVKLADILHNLSSNPSEHAKQKYLKAIPILLQNL